MTEEIRVLDVGCSPEAAVSAPILLQSDDVTTLIFNAVRLVDTEYEEAGRAVVKFAGCSITKFGYPNDEAWAAIPRTRGLSYDFHEVFDSEWEREIARLNRHAFPNFARPPRRHFLVLFHDSSFECLARDLTVTLSNAPLSELLSEVSGQLLES